MIATDYVEYRNSVFPYASFCVY